MDKRQQVLDELDRQGIGYKMEEHPPVFTIEDMENLGLSQHGAIVKNLFLRDSKGRRHFLVMLREDKHANLNVLMKKLQSTKLSFASDDRLEKYLGLTKGAVTPFGILNDEDCAVEVVFDKDLRGKESLGVHPNENTATLFLPFGDIEQVVKEHGNEVKYIKI